MLTKEQQTILLQDAASLSNMGDHVRSFGDTPAERVMKMLGGQKNTPRKMSYLYCDAVDACFYFSDDKAYCTFTARWFDGAKDLDHLQDAGALIKTMLHNMQMLADATLKGVGNATSNL